MIENQLERYLLEKEQTKRVEEKKVVVETEIDDFDINVSIDKKKKRRDINDILGL